MSVLAGWVFVLVALAVWPRRPASGMLATARACVDGQSGRGQSGRGHPARTTSANGRGRTAATGALATERAPTGWPSWARRRSPGSGWVAEFAELSVLGLEAGLPPGEAAELACDVGWAAGGQGAGRGGAEHEWSRTAAVVASARREGLPVGEALRDAAGSTGRGDQDLAFLAAAWGLSEDLGAPTAPAAARVAEVVRGRVAARERRTALLAGPRASMWVLSALPVAGPGLAMAVGLPVRQVYADAPALLLLGAGIALTGFGWVWSAAMLARAARPARLAADG